MSFIVEDGSLVDNANSYVSVEYANSYFEDKGNVLWTSLTTEQIESRLVIATQYIDTIYFNKFKGNIVSDKQSLAFPRDYFIKDDKMLYFIPKRLKDACCEYALNVNEETMSLTTTFDTSDTSGEIKRKKEVVGALQTETEYFSSSSNAKVELSVYVLADNLIKPLLKTANCMRCIRN